MAAVCHPDWTGVKHATLGLQLKTYPWRDKGPGVWEKNFVRVLLSRGVKKVIVGGIPPAIATMVRFLVAAHIDVYVAYHGSFHLQGADPFEAEAFADVIRLVREGKVKGLGLVKHGMADTLKELFEGLNVVELWNPLVDHPFVGAKYSAFDGLVHIGVLVGSRPLKNAYAQILSACALPNVVVHVFEHNIMGLVVDACEGKLAVHPNMANNQFKRLLSELDVLLHVYV